MPSQTTELFLLEDLEDVGRTGELAESDLDALHAVADWIKSFVVRPHTDLGRAGPVCPFVPGALERETLWLAPERIADRGVPDVVELIEGYKRLLLSAQPADGDDATYKVIVVVFTDLSADRAQEVFDDVHQQLAVPSYKEDGILFGPFYEGNQGTAIYNSHFRPFQSPVPFLFVRQGVISDWKFFLDNDDLLSLWAQRFGESAVHALAEELRRLPWRAGGASDRETSVMNPARAHELLSAERARITRSLAQLRHADTAEPDDYVDSAANLAAELYQDELDEGLADDLRRQLAAVERAEKRLAAGTYGLSIESRRPIPDERLEAIPTAERTTDEETRRT